MKDTERLKKDLKEFYSKFKYYCNKRKVKPPEYITIIEPQGRGAWHAHIIFIFKKIPPFIPKAELEKIWGFGFVDIKAVDENCDNVGAYLSAYVGNLALDDVKDVRTCLHKNLAYPFSKFRRILRQKFLQYNSISANF